VNGLGHETQCPVHQLVHVLGVEPFGQPRRLDDIDEQHRHELALAFERRPGGQDLLGQIPRRVDVGSRGARVAGTSADRFPAREAELGRRRQLGVALHARRGQPSPAFQAEPGLRRSVGTATRTSHGNRTQVNPHRRQRQRRSAQARGDRCGRPAETAPRSGNGGACWIS
jgi:hypothetical protein